MFSTSSLFKFYEKTGLTAVSRHVPANDTVLTFYFQKSVLFVASPYGPGGFTQFFDTGGD
jgi:hypothetical protein